MSRRRILLTSPAGIPETTPFVKLDQEEDQLCSIDYRGYSKAYAGVAWCAIIYFYDPAFPESYWRMPVLLADTPEACVRDPDIEASVISVQYQGKHWYYCGSQYAMPTSMLPEDKRFSGIADNTNNLCIICNPLRTDGLFWGDSGNGGVMTANKLLQILYGNLNAKIIRQDA